MGDDKKCQSCGMSLRNDPVGGGTNTDGSKSNLYCSYCFDDGKFLQPDITLGEMKKLVKGKMHEMGFPKITIWFSTLRIQRLKRWCEKH